MDKLKDLANKVGHSSGSGTTGTTGTTNTGTGAAGSDYGDKGMYNGPVLLLAIEIVISHQFQASLPSRRRPATACPPTRMRR
jgi:hypothetical protein